MRSSNRDVGGRTVELPEFEFMVRGRDYLKGVEDNESIGLRGQDGMSLRLSDVANVEVVGDERMIGWSRNPNLSPHRQMNNLHSFDSQAWAIPRRHMT